MPLEHVILKNRIVLLEKRQTYVPRVSPALLHKESTDSGVVQHTLDDPFMKRMQNMKIWVQKTLIECFQNI